MKNIFTKDLNKEENIKTNFMIMKILSRDYGKVTAYIGDKTGDIKAIIEDENNELNVGNVIYVEGKIDGILEVEKFKVETEYNIEDYLPTVKRPVEDILKEIEDISNEEFKSHEVIALNNYFFGNNEFVDKFKKGIGGLKQHHNYIGGLAEHTLNVMYMAKTLAYRYDCRHKEIAILAAKLHDIGKVEEYFVDGPFSVTMRGDMEGHIVIAISMLEDAFREGGEIYSQDFKDRIKGCLVQHHGKQEYGSPKVPNSEEAYIVHFADYVDATMNKISQIKDITQPNTWSEYDRRIGTRLFI
ncbi:HD domain-containing protein [Clostridium botulinum C]|uniref:HD domain-containing protein n=2 Tax=Clostridium botulinum TaxID=1491 RepID=A0A9Q4TFY6_CLOBO|nr:HD domain-containing protein [Clostridium botulinum]MCD3193707.1 HD domain-containing protein [Clostridium botulinum C]MCD3199775.1 HD domain-containing protein [Clostridium botulinum C]MCD3205250.1 HD domain-containing protein [Clostridium botulinum C]MCD3207176.1 HD domain-containing protein [Clostridium botulinum C]MCD3224578.1 HD domain-containing protein [Clostridium botulinum C]